MLTVLLLSGGIDSAALAVLTRPDLTVFIDYGQRPANTERRAAAAVAKQLDLQHHEVTVGLSSLGSGLMSDDHQHDGWPSPEWWPYRNQLLVTCAAAWLTTNVTLLNESMPLRAKILMGTVASDGDRHLDGSRPFFEALNAVLASQEGDVSVDVPAIDMTTQQLVVASGVTDSVLGWTHSCHIADLPCSSCPGCHKRQQVLTELNRLN